MKLNQFPVVAAGLTAAVLAAGGVTALTYAASSPFPNEQRPTVIETSTTAGFSHRPARAEDHPAARGHHGRHHHHGEAEARHHGREAEPGDDRGGDDSGRHGGDDHGSGGHGSDD